MAETSASARAFNPDLRAALVAMVRKRVPESEVEDIVQATLAEAVESPHAPAEPEALRRWIFGVAKNKVVDYHRRAGRVTFDLPEVSDGPAPHAEADLLRWAERNLPPGEDAKKTLAWMLREGDGEKLESIAESEHVPAPRVRQRVSRLRRHLKEHWAREVAVLAALGVAITVLVLWILRKPEPEPIANDPHAVPIDPRAEGVRKSALERCAASDWKRCVDGLDEAKRLDPAGDARPEVQRARRDAEKALAPAPTALPPAPTEAPTASPEPTTSAAPTPRPTAAPRPTAPPPPAPSAEYQKKMEMFQKKAAPQKPSPKSVSDPSSIDFGSDVTPSLGSVPAAPPSKSTGSKSANAAPQQAQAQQAPLKKK